MMMKTNSIRIISSISLLVVLFCIHPATLYAQGDGPLYQSDVEESGYQTEDLDEETVLEIEHALNKARILVELDKIDSAILMYYDILKKDPGNIAALEDMLKVFFKTNNWAMVIFTLERMIELKPDDAMLREVLLIVYRYYQMPERELPVELQLAAIQPENTEYLTSLAETLQEYGFYEESIDFYEDAHKIEPENDKFVQRIAELYEGRSNMAQTIRYYTKLAELRPDDKKPKMKLARMYLEDGQTGEALKIYETTLSQYPENVSLQREVRRLYKVLASQYFDRERFYLSKDYFELAGEGQYAAPFAREYAEDVKQEMGLKALYDFKWADYRFNGQDTVRISHEPGVELFSWRYLSKPTIQGRRLHIENKTHEFDVDEIRFGTDIIFGMRLDTHLEFGYSNPEDIALADGEMIYENTWHYITNPRGAINAGLDLGIERTRLVDTVEAVERGIFKTEYTVAYSRYFWGRLWTVGTYKYADITGGNYSHFATLDFAYTLYQKDKVEEEDPDEVKVPLYIPEDQHLGVGVNAEYITYKETNNMYFTIEEELYLFARAEYARNFFDYLTVGLSGAIGWATMKGELIKDGTISVILDLPFRLDAELAYTISDVYATENGKQKITRDYGLNLNFLLYF